MTQITNYFSDIINTFSLLSLVDILIMTVIIYLVINLIIGTQAEQVAKGIIIILAITQLSSWFGLVTVNFVFKNMITVGFLALLIMFQPELRKVLETLGRANMSDIKSMFEQKNLASPESVIDELVDAILYFRKTKTGALIAIQRKDILDDIVNTGVGMDSFISSELVKNVFYHNTPLHDGAMIISDETLRIRACGCILPLSKNNNLSTSIGTRHRAGVGLSEMYDCLVFIVSEETGTISYALNGRLSRFIDEHGLRRILNEILISADEESDTFKGKVKRLGGHYGKKW